MDWTTGSLFYPKTVGTSEPFLITHNDHASAPSGKMSFMLWPPRDTLPASPSYAFFFGKFNQWVPSPLRSFYKCSALPPPPQSGFHPFIGLYILPSPVSTSFQISRNFLCGQGFPIPPCTVAHGSIALSIAPGWTYPFSVQFRPPIHRFLGTMLPPPPQALFLQFSTLLTIMRLSACGPPIPSRLPPLSKRPFTTGSACGTSTPRPFTPAGELSVPWRAFFFDQGLGVTAWKYPRPYAPPIPLSLTLSPSIMQKYPPSYYFFAAVQRHTPHVTVFTANPLSSSSTRPGIASSIINKRRFTPLNPQQR